MTDFGTLTIADRMLLVHAAYGKAMLCAHGLEHSLATLLICKISLSKVLHNQSKAEVAKIKRLPLGVLIEKFAVEFSHSDQLREELSNLLFFRNELAHRISDSIISAAVEVNWEERIISELEEICGYFRDCRPLLAPYIDHFQSQLGLTDENVIELIRVTYPGSGVGT
jgi:hypothetical protein